MKITLAVAIALGLFFSGSSARAWTLVSSSGAGWAVKRLPIYFDPTSCGLSQAEMETLVDEAIRTWNGVPTAELTLVRVPEPVRVTPESFLAGTAAVTPVILCDPAFAASNAVDGDRIPASTRLSSAAGRINYGGVMLNSEPTAAASITRLTRAQVLVTLAHELGHVLGLGHSSSSEALMYFSIGGKSEARLTQDDRDGITFLYPRNEFTGGPLGCAAVHGGQNAEGGAPWGVPFAVLFLFALVRLGRLLSLRGSRP